MLAVLAIRRRSLTEHGYVPVRCSEHDCATRGNPPGSASYFVVLREALNSELRTPVRVANETFQYAPECAALGNRAIGATSGVSLKKCK